MTDIRLTDVVKEQTEKNLEYLEEKSTRIANKVRDMITEEYENKYDESCIYIVYTRKGNDINTLWCDVRIGNTVMTSADEKMFWWIVDELKQWYRESDDL